MFSKFQAVSLLRTCVLLLILLACARTHKRPWESNFVKFKCVCKTKECYEYGRNLAQYVNPSVDPCDDFYEHVCGNWKKQHPLPPKINEWSTDSIMQMKEYERIESLLEEPISEEDSPEMMFAKKYHKACMEIPSIGVLKYSAIRKYMKETNFFPLLLNPREWEKHQKSWQTIHNYYLSITGESGLFMIFLTTRAREDILLFVRELNSPYGALSSILLSNDQQKNYIEFLKALVKKVLPNDALGVSDSVMEKGLLKVIAFRYQLLKMEKTASDSTPMTVEELDIKYRSMSENKKITAHIDWINTIRAFRGYKDTRIVAKRIQINFDNEVYFKSLASLLGKTPMDVIVNHVHLYFLERYTEFDPSLKRLLLDVVIKNGKLQGKLRNTWSRFLTCLGSNERRETIGRRYVRTYFKESTKIKGERMINRLKEILKLQIEDSTWLDHRSMTYFQKKVDFMKIVIGCPEYYTNPLKRYTNPAASLLDPLKVEAFYLSGNTLCVSAAYFNLPIYSPNLPDAVVYGALGNYLSHEMYHAFGPLVIERSKPHIYWSDEMLGKYMERVDCVIDKYNKLPIKELEMFEQSPTINGRRTVEENLADIMGLKLAYLTFKKKVWEKRRCEVVPHMLDISCDKLFFLSYALTFCSTLSPDAMLHNIETGVHSTDRIRVNGAVSNMMAFRKTFNCSTTKPEVESEMCDLWK